MNNEDALLIPDQLFPCDNDLEIPTLDLSIQATSCDIPFLCFGEQKRTFNLNNTGTLHFYTDDYRFTQCTNIPKKYCSTIHVI